MLVVLLLARRIHIEGGRQDELNKVIAIVQQLNSQCFLTKTTCIFCCFCVTVMSNEIRRKPEMANPYNDKKFLFLWTKEDYCFFLFIKNILKNKFKKKINLNTG